MNHKKIAIICPVWNGMEDLPELFQNLNKIDYNKKNLELILVDNGSKDQSVNFIKNQFESMSVNNWSKLLLIENDENVGIPAAYNQCYQEISHDTYAILRIETDIIMNEDLLNHMLSVMLKEQNAGIIGAYIDGDGDYRWGATYYSKYTEKYTIKYPDEVSECDAVFGCCMLIKKETVENLEYFFDSNLFIGNDETDLCFRVSKAGYKIFYQPKAIVFHKSGKSTSKISDITKYYYIRNGIIMIRKHANFLKYIYTISKSFIYVVWWRTQGNRISIRAFFDGLFFDINKQTVPKIVSL